MVLGNLHLSQEVPKDEVLQLTNNLQINSALELLEALKTMNQETFTHHVTDHYNDFSDWILENYHDEELAMKLFSTHKKEKMIRILQIALKKELDQYTKENKKTKNTETKKILHKQKRKEILKQIGELNG
jgi:hypothetical protein